MILELEFINQIIKDPSLLEKIKPKYKKVLSCASFVELYNYNIILNEYFDLEYMNHELKKNYNKTIHFFTKETPYNLYTIQILLVYIESAGWTKKLHPTHLPTLLYYLSSIDKIVDINILKYACESNKDLVEGLKTIPKYNDIIKNFNL